jgi:hypothetical protein
MRKPVVIIAAVALSIPVLGGIGYAAIQSVASTPEPEVILPATISSHGDDSSSTPDRSSPSTVLDDHGGARTGASPSGGSDDPVTHDVGDDHGGLRSPSSAGGPSGPTTTPSTIDDHGGRRSSGTTPDTIDDHGGRRTETTVPASPSSPTTVDDHGGRSGGGHGRHG